MEGTFFKLNKVVRSLHDPITKDPVSFELIFKPLNVRTTSAIDLFYRKCW